MIHLHFRLATNKCLSLPLPGTAADKHVQLADSSLVRQLEAELQRLSAVARPA
jgi:hypothetical protein